MADSFNEQRHAKLRHILSDFRCLGPIALLAILLSVALPSQSRGAENKSPSSTASESKTEITTVIIAAAVGGIVSYVGALIESSLTARAKIDENLRNQRLEVYKPLWELTGILPKWPKSEDVTYEEMEKFSDRLRKWYFETGGIYLSVPARNAYVELQESLQSIQQKGKKGKLDGDYEIIRKPCSALRTELTNDLLSRSRDWWSDVCPKE